MVSIQATDIKKTVSRLCIEANYFLNSDIYECFVNSLETETNEMAKQITGILIENADIAKAEECPICQDTGMAVLFVDIGQEVAITGGDISEAIHSGVRDGYEKGYLRKSVVNDPIERINTKDNTPAIIHYNIVPGDKLKITVAPKGFGSENMSKLIMLKPADGIEGIKKFVLDAVIAAGPNPCPPIILGIGIGGTLEKSAIMAKKALLRKVGAHNENAYWAGIETELLSEINKLNIGPSGFGGKLTCMGVHIDTYATHIAGLPVCVNFGCHVTRHAESYIGGVCCE